MTDAPIEEVVYLREQVVDLASVRVARGMARRKSSNCSHTHLVYSAEERRVWCEQCRTSLESFDAFMTIVNMFDAMMAEARKEIRQAAEGKRAVLHRIAAKALERIWRRKMAACCPHCGYGLLPEDLEKSSAVSRDIEIARRKRARSSHDL